MFCSCHPCLSLYISQILNCRLRLGKGLKLFITRFVCININNPMGKIREKKLCLNAQNPTWYYIEDALERIRGGGLNLIAYKTSKGLD